MKKYRNPNVKTNWNDDELKMLSDQLNVYFFHIQKLEGSSHPGLESYKWIENCSICTAVEDACTKCPISFEGPDINIWRSCMSDDSYVPIRKRRTMTLQQAKKRLKRLIQYYEANGLEVTEEKFKQSFDYEVEI